MTKANLRLGIPWQLGPKRQFKPIDTLPLVSIQNAPIIRFYDTTNWSAFIGFAL